MGCIVSDKVRSLLAYPMISKMFAYYVDNVYEY